MLWQAAISVAVVVLTTFSTATAAALPIEAPLWWRDPAAQGVKWRGMLPTEGGGVSMGPQIGPYPAAGAAGLLAGILTHAAIANSVQSSQYQQAQQASDRVLEPYAAALGKWSTTDLWRATLAIAPPSLGIRAWDGATSEEDGTVFETAPTFSMALDETVVVLDVVIKLVAHGAAPVEASVRVISSPLGPVNPRQYWSADEARQLKSTAAAMLAHAIDIARRYAIQPTDGLAPMRTYRYTFGDAERTERAQQLAAMCSRLELRNLRGLLMSVPIKAASEGDCPNPLLF